VPLEQAGVNELAEESQTQRVVKVIALDRMAREVAYALATLENFNRDATTLLLKREQPGLPDVSSLLHSKFLPGGAIFGTQAELLSLINPRFIAFD